MQLANRFEVSRPPDEAFALLLDAPAIVACVPGAELTGVEAEGVYKGRISVRLGPVALKFNGVVNIGDIDRQACTALIRARGADLQGRGNANATTKMRVEPSGEGAAVVLETDLQLSGMVAQYGRAQGVIVALSNEIVAEFARNLQSMLKGEGVPESARKDISALSLAWRALRGKSGA